jgi:hypothetical protein
MGLLELGNELFNLQCRRRIEVINVWLVIGVRIAMRHGKSWWGDIAKGGRLQGRRLLCFYWCVVVVAVQSVLSFMATAIKLIE